MVSLGILRDFPSSLTNLDSASTSNLTPYKGLLAGDATAAKGPVSYVGLLASDATAIAEGRKLSVIKVSGPSDLLANLEGPVSTDIFTGGTNLDALVKKNLSSDSITSNLTGKPTDSNAAEIANSTILETSMGDSSSSAPDYRVRIRAGTNSAQVEQVLGKNDPTTNILSILYETNGLMFPYTPTIAVSQSVNWDPMSLVHTNYDVLSYQRTPSVTISVTGTFTAQNQREGEYLMAVLHFLRVVTKSYYGVEDAKKGLAGVPPPVLYFEGHGNFIFNKIPCVIKSYSYSFEDGIDSNVFTARMSSLKARLPAKMSIQMELGVQINPNKQKNEFSLDSFRTGKNLEFF
jgi:hypothetical protein